MVRTYHEVFSRTSQKKEVTTGRPRQKSVSERLRFTSNVAEFTVTTWTTGCRRNASSWKSTPRAKVGLEEMRSVLRGLCSAVLMTRSGENSMLRISLKNTPTEERWILHGWVSDPWVHELR